jgi:hypothetical protein
VIALSMSWRQPRGAVSGPGARCVNGCCLEGHNCVQLDGEGMPVTCTLYHAHQAGLGWLGATRGEHG